MRLFDERQRTHLGYGLGAEPDFRFLNKTARPEFECTRRLLERWFQGYPADERGKLDVRQRFRSKANREHQAAFFELYCLALLHSMGMDVQAHPTVDTAMLTKPDFLAHFRVASADMTVGAAQGTSVFYLECRIDSQPNEETAAHICREQVIDILDRMQSPDYFFSADVWKVGANMPSIGKIRAFLRGKMEGTSAGEALQRLATNPYDEGWVWEEGGWKIEFIPMSRPL